LFNSLTIYIQLPLKAIFDPYEIHAKEWFKKQQTYFKCNIKLKWDLDLLKNT
jgi:hypothetical protein